MTTRPQTARERGCYCDAVDDNFRREQGIPDGYCGICESCGQPGHTRHHPGPVPYTGAWCDPCYRRLAWTWPFRTPIGWVMLCVLALLLVFALPHLLRLVE